MSDVKYDAILVGGLDNRSGDLNINQQTAKFKEGFGAQKNVKSYRYNHSTSDILNFLSRNPYLPIFLFSAGCTKAYDFSRSKFVNKNLLFVIEPYAASPKTAEIINKAVIDGVPASNIYVGSGSARGAGVVKGTSSSGAASHWDALKEVGKKQSGISQLTSTNTQQQGTIGATASKPEPNAKPKPPANTNVNKTMPTVAIGDFISLTLQKKYSGYIGVVEKLTGDITTTGDFIEKLKKSDVKKDITKVIISVGSLEAWVSTRDTGSTLFNLVGSAQVATLKNELVLQLRRVFPNSQLYILNGSWGWKYAPRSVSKPSTSAAAESKSRFTYEYVKKPIGEKFNDVIVVYDKGVKIFDFEADTAFAVDIDKIFKAMKNLAIERLQKKYGDEIRNMRSLHDEKFQIPEKNDLSVTSTCSDDCWSKKIDSYMLYFLDKKFTVLGTKKKLSNVPKLDDALFSTFDEDLKKYAILPSPNVVAGTQSQAPPQGQPTSKGDFNNPGDEKKQDSQKNQLTSDGIVNLFPTKIVPKEIVIPTPENSEIKTEFTNGMGFLPIIWYNAYQIDMQDIQVFSINYEGILPILSLVFRDTAGVIKDKGTPIDNNNITVFISSRSRNLRSVHLQFKIKTFTNNDGLMSMTGTIDIDGLYIKNYKTYKDSTSNKALQDICKEIGLGFNTNVVETNDRMNWLNTGLRAYEFMEEILDHAYISDEAFVSGNLDLFYNFNFVDVQKELSRNIEKEIGISTTSLSEILKLPPREDGAVLFLTNDESMAGSNSYFSSFRIYNRATKTALEQGYSDNFVYYDTNFKKVHSFDIHSMNLNEDSSIILKGGKNDNGFYEQNKKFVYSGKLDSDNSHVNYNFTKTNNNRNIYEAEKLGAELELPYPNFNIYRFQKLRLVFSHNAPTPANPQINSRYTGDWLVVDVNYSFVGSRFKQTISLVRRELGLTSEEIVEGVVNKQRPEGRGNFSNPSGGYATQSAAPITPVSPGRTDPGTGTGVSPNVPQEVIEEVTEVTGRIVAGKINKAMSFVEVTKEVILNLEGGYYHPNMLQDGRVKDGRYGKSGETMYGLDRKAGGEPIRDCVPCKKFWGLLDQAGASKNWKWNYIPPEPLKTQLLNLAVEIMKPLYERNLQNYVPEPQLKKILNSDGRLLFNSIYATWNGPGWFQGFMQRLRDAYNKGTTKADDLTVLFVKTRKDNRGVIGNSTNNSLIAQGADKIAKLVGVDLSTTTRTVRRSAPSNPNAGAGAPTIQQGGDGKAIQKGIQTGVTTTPNTGGVITSGYLPLERLTKTTQNLIRTSPGLVLVREGATQYRTAGTMWYRGKVIGVTVEDAVRTKKIDKQTAIPAGTFNIKLDTTGNQKLLDSYVKFPESAVAKYRNPGVFPRVGTSSDAGDLVFGGLVFDGVRIHRGSSEGSSAGCIIYSSERYKDGKIKTDLEHNFRLTRLINSDNIKTITVIDEFKNLS